MSDSDRRHNCFGSVVRILSTVVLFAVAMTFVWVRSGRATAKGSVHHAGGGSVARDHGPNMLVSNATHETREQGRVWTAGSVIIQGPAGEQTPRHHARAIDEKYVLNNNQNANELAYDVIEKSSEENTNLIDRSGWTTFFNRLAQNISRGLWLLETSERSGSSDRPSFGDYRSYQNKKDLEYRFGHDANINRDIPEAQLLKHFPPTYKIDFNANPNLDTRQDNLFLQPPGTPAVQNNNTSSSSQPTAKDIPIISEITWRRIGLMALVKLGLVNLKVIGFIKILFFLLVKLTFILMILFFKFISLLKFMKISILPLFFLPLGVLFFQTIMRMSPAHTLLIDILGSTNNAVIPSTAEITIPNNEEVVIAPSPLSQETVIVSSSETVVVPPSETVVVPPSETVVIPPAQTQIQVIPPVQPVIPPDVIAAFEQLPPSSGQRYEPLGVIDPNLDFFQMELNSEKCIERIACKIAATGKTGIIPLWINWVLHRVSKSVPSDQLLYYFKAYDDVINEIHMKSPNPDNWETWCFERYDCNNTDTI